MRRGNGGGYKPPDRPVNSEEGAAAVRKSALKLFVRDDGEAVDWPLVAESLFRVAFECLDRIKDDKRRLSILRRLEAGAYDRLARNEPEAWAVDPAGPRPLPIPGHHVGLDGPELNAGPRRPPGRPRS